MVKEIVHRKPACGIHAAKAVKNVSRIPESLRDLSIPRVSAVKATRVTRGIENLSPACPGTAACPWQRQAVEDLRQNLTEPSILSAKPRCFQVKTLQWLLITRPILSAGWTRNRGWFLMVSHKSEATAASATAFQSLAAGQSGCVGKPSARVLSVEPW